MVRCLGCRLRPKAKHLTDVSAKNIDNCIEQVKVGKNIFSVNMQITITNCEFASNKKE